MTGKGVQTCHVAVFLGGPSAEREVSLRSGAAVARALRFLGHEVREIDPIDSKWEIPRPCDAAFIALHGAYGEDGTLQEQLEAAGVPFTGCDAASSRRAFDKLETKRCCLDHGLPTPPFHVVKTPDAPWPDGWSAPLVVKPVRQGSSVGLGFIQSQDDWRIKLSEALTHDTVALVEPRIEGREVTVGILGGEVLPLVEVCPCDGRYDYRNKYTEGATVYLCPAPLDPALTTRIQQVGLSAFCAVGGRDYGRVDIMVDHSGTPWVLEVNTIPGMTPTSLLPKAAAAAGIPFEALCNRMLELALRRKAQR